MRKFLVAVWMMTAATCLAQQIDLKALDKLGAKAKEKTEINMDESMLKSALGFLQEGDEAVAKSVKGLKGFFLRSYAFAEKGAYRMEDLKPILDQLKAPGWSPFLRSQEEDELTEIWMHQTNGQMDGMILVAAEGNEVTVINAVGMVNLSDLSALGKLGDAATKQQNPKPGTAPKD
jgi:Domain of unknown function (DUF4252)